MHFHHDSVTLLLAKLPVDLPSSLCLVHPAVILHQASFNDHRSKSKHFSGNSLNAHLHYHLTHLVAMQDSDNVTQIKIIY